MNVIQSITSIILQHRNFSTRWFVANVALVTRTQGPSHTQYHTILNTIMSELRHVLILPVGPVLATANHVYDNQLDELWLPWLATARNVSPCIMHVNVITQFALGGL